MSNSLSFYRGDAFSFDVDLVLNSTAINLNEYTAFFTMKKRTTDPDSKAVARKNSGSASSSESGGVDILSATEGKIRVVLLHQDTKDLLEGTYYFGINVVNKADSALFYTLLQGSITVKLDIGARIVGDPT